MSQRAKRKGLQPHRRCKWKLKEQKQVFDHTRAEYGGVKQKMQLQLQNKKGLQYSSQRAEKPRVEGQKASCGLRATICPPLT